MFPGQFILLLRIQWKFKEAVRCAGKLYDGKNIQSIRIDLQSLYVGEEGAIRLPQGDELEKLKEENPHYSEQGRLDITDSGGDRRADRRLKAL